MPNRLATSTLAALLVCGGALQAAAGPTGGTVISGGAVITPMADSTLVTQSSDVAIIHWTDFSVAAGEVVVFDQPGLGAVTLNRVIGPAISVIDGQVLASGQVWILNPNGILIGAGGAVIADGGFLASTGFIDDDVFLGGFGESRSGEGFTFTGAPAGSAVVNRGVIAATGSGAVVIAAPRVENSGKILTASGDVFLGSVTELVIDLDGGIVTWDETVAAGSGVDARGEITAGGEGAQIALVGLAPGILDIDVVSTGGALEASSLVVLGGETVLIAGGTGGASVRGTGAEQGAVVLMRQEAGDVVAEVSTRERRARSQDTGGGCGAEADSLVGDGCIETIWFDPEIALGDDPFTNRGAEENWR